MTQRVDVAAKELLLTNSFADGNAEKKPKPAVAIPEKLSHVVHPPTRSLYISGLKRPLQNPDLKEYLEEQGGELDASVGSGMWVSGVKDHTYCTVSAHTSTHRFGS